MHLQLFTSFSACPLRRKLCTPPQNSSSIDQSTQQQTRIQIELHLMQPCMQGLMLSGMDADAANAAAAPAGQSPGSTATPSSPPPRAAKASHRHRFNFLPVFLSDVHWKGNRHVITRHNVPDAITFVVSAHTKLYLGGKRHKNYGS